MAERLAPPVARRGNAVLARPDEVVEVRGEPALVEDHRLLRRRSLVVDPVAAPPVRVATVVVGGHERRRELLAEAAGVDAGALLDRVGLESVADRLVEEHTAETVADHDRKTPRRGLDRVEQGQRLARGLAGDLMGGAADDLEAAMCAARLVAGLGAPVATATTCTPSRTRVRLSAAARPSEL